MTLEVLIPVGLGVLNSILIPLIAFPIKEQRRQLVEARDELKAVRGELKCELDQQRQAHAKLLEDLPRNYILREEYMRVMAGMDKKLDDLIGEVRSLNRDLRRHVEKEAGRDA